MVDKVSATLVFQIIVALCGFLGGWTIWSMRKSFVYKEAFAQQVQNLDRLERQVENLPNQSAIHELAISVEQLRGELGTVSARMDGLREIMAKLDSTIMRQEEFLLKDK